MPLEEVGPIPAPRRWPSPLRGPPGIAGLADILLQHRGMPCVFDAVVLARGTVQGRLAGWELRVKAIVSKVGG